MSVTMDIDGKSVAIHLLLAANVIDMLLDVEHLRLSFLHFLLHPLHTSIQFPHPPHGRAPYPGRSAFITAFIRPVLSSKG